MSKISKDHMEKLTDFLASVSDDPLKFVKVVFPWNSGALKDMAGPQGWQIDVMEDIKTGICGKNTPIRIAVASGHGVGKSALAAWLILWSIATKPDTRGVVTANTETQLKTKTWAELAKWLRISLVAPIFNITSDSIFSVDKRYEKTWRIDMIPWSASNTEAFAGLHNSGRRILLIFDEASAISDKIWEVTEGALTDSNSEIIWAAFGNPTRPDGMFRECFGRFRHRWLHRQVDSRTSDITNKSQLAKLIEDYGIDSNFVKVRVLGEFPSQGKNTFIPLSIVEEAVNRKISDLETADEPKIIGIDAARFGDDSSVIVKRRGRICLSVERFTKIDTMTLAGIAAERIKEFLPDAVFVDATGVGGGVVDRLIQMGLPVIGVDFGSRPTDKTKYYNKRAEMWGRMAKWLKESGRIPYDKDLISDLAAPSYGFAGDRGQIILEKKEDMKKRGLASPDAADALALTFAEHVAKRSIFEDLPGYNDTFNDLTQTNI